MEPLRPEDRVRRTRLDRSCLHGENVWREGGSDAVLKRLAGMEKQEQQRPKVTQRERALVLFLSFFHLVFLDSSGEIAGCAMVSPVELCLKPLDDDWLCTYIQVLMLNYWLILETLGVLTYWSFLIFILFVYIVLISMK